MSYVSFSIEINLKPMDRQGRIKGRWKKAVYYDWMVLEAMKRNNVNCKKFVANFVGQRLFYEVELESPMKIEDIRPIINLVCEKRKLRSDHREYIASHVRYVLEQI